MRHPNATSERSSCWLQIAHSPHGINYLRSYASHLMLSTSTPTATNTSTSTFTCTSHAITDAFSNHPLYCQTTVGGPSTARTFPNETIDLLEQRPSYRTEISLVSIRTSQFFFV